MELKAIFSRLRLDESALEPVNLNWDLSVASFPGRAPEFLWPEKYRENYSYSGLEQETLQVLDAVAEKIRVCPDLTILIWHCYQSQYVYDEQRFRDWPRFEGQLGEDCAVFYLLVALAVIPLVTKKYKEFGIPEQYAAALCSRISGFNSTYRSGHGRDGINPFQLFWYRFYADAKIFRIGRFEFWPKEFRAEDHCFAAFVNRASGKVVALQRSKFNYDSNGWCIGAGENTPVEFEGSDYLEESGYAAGVLIEPQGCCSGEITRLDQREWQPAFSEGDTILEMHIPEGGKMTPQACRQSLIDALDFFGKYFPERKIRGFNCYSWIFYPFYEQVLPQSNLADFMRNVYLAPSYSGEAHEGFYFIFGRGYKAHEQYPRDNSMRRLMLGEIEKGRHLRGGAMFFLAEHVRLYGTQPYRTSLKV